ncbi:MAG: hypothetical protein HQ542_06625 [Bacteroidia bacterium]|nr:hypothetical protein [Bacteroidia bacterium]
MEQLHSMYPPECVPFVDAFLVSGSEARELMIRHTPYIDKDKIKVVGDPRFDLYKPQYADFWKRDLEELHTKYSDFVLNNTSFKLCNSRLVSESLRSGILDNPDYSDEYKEMRLFKQKFTLDAMHQFIDPILGARTIIQYDCTTGVEAVLAGKPVIAFVLEKDERILFWLPVYMSKEASSVGELVHSLSFLREESAVAPEPGIEKLSLLNNYVFNVSEESSGTIVRVLNERASTMTPEEGRFCVN